MDVYVNSVYQISLVVNSGFRRTLEIGRACRDLILTMVCEADREPAPFR